MAINTIASPHVSSIAHGEPAITYTKFFFFLCIALAYGFVLSKLPDESFKDFENYIFYADHSCEIILRFMDRGWLSFLANEPVWLLINAGLGLFLTPEKVIQTVVFLGAFSTAWLMLRHYPKYFILIILFLFLPQVIKNYLIHLRQGLAISIFLLGWFADKRQTRWMLMGATPFIHSSFFFILSLLFLSGVLRSIHIVQNIRIKMFSYLLAGIVVGVTLGALSALLGARQADEYVFGRNLTVSGFGFMLWAMILGVMLTAGKTWLLEHDFEIAIVIFYLATYALIPVSARIFESGVILVLLAGLTLRGERRLAFLGLVLGSGVMLWGMRIGQLALGFGVG